MECLAELWNLRRWTRRSSRSIRTVSVGTNGSRKEPRGRGRTLSIETLCTSDTFIEEAELEHSPTVVALGNMRKKEITSVCPSKNYAYLSNHVRVNQERQQRGLALLMRCAILDEMARDKARQMALAGTVLTPYGSSSIVEHVQRTFSLQLLHQLTMHGIDNHARQCILDPRFVKFGMGTARGADGMIYVSQLFQGTPLTRTATTKSCANGSLDRHNNDSSQDLAQQVFVPTSKHVLVKNPTTRIFPTIDIQVDPNLLRTKQSKANRRTWSSDSAASSQQRHFRSSKTIVSTKEPLVPTSSAR